MLSYIIINYLILSYIILHSHFCPILSYICYISYMILYSSSLGPIRYYNTLSHTILYYPILSFIVLHYRILSYIILYYPILSVDTTQADSRPPVKLARRPPPSLVHKRGSHGAFRG